MFCTQCGTPLPATNRFCGSCGTPVVTGTITGPTNAQAGTTPGDRGTRQLGDRGTRQLGDRRVVTVLFMDVSGFTAMSEKLDPEQVTDIVNQFFKVLSEPIVRYGGTIDKYMGDAIMAIFGAPVAHEDDPVRAVSAAWRMQQEARRFAQALEARTGIHLRVRIGLNTGLVIAGTVGSEQRSDYTVMGDTVNLAQRMEAAATPGRVLVTEETYQQAREAFDFTALPPISVKGKAEKVPVFELVGPHQEGDGGRSLRLVGRDEALSGLEQAMERALAGVPQLVVVTGEAGFGKSALVRAFIATVRARAAFRVVRGRCFSFDQGDVYSMLRRMLLHWLSLSEDAPPRDVAQALRSAVEPLPFADRERALLHLGGLLSLDASPGGREYSPLALMDAHDRREAAFAALGELICLLAGEGPLVVSLDDVHWADEGSRGWLSAFRQRLEASARGELPLLLLVQRRAGNPGTEFLLSPARRPEVHELVLAPLSREQGLLLVADRLQAETPPEAWPDDLRVMADELVARSDGNPYYLDELIHTQQQAGGLVLRDGRWVIGEGRPVLPGSIAGLLAARLDGLSSEAREVLAAMAVGGLNVDRGLVAELATVQDFDSALGELVAQGILRERADGSLTFVQALVQEVAYQKLLVKVRKELHFRVAEALETRHADHLEDLAPALARHCAAADHPRAVRYLYLAATHARNCFANELAVQFYQDTLARLTDFPISGEQGPPVWRILTDLAEVETILGRYEQALDHLKQGLAERPEGIGERSLLLQAMGNIQERKGEFAQALATYEEALKGVNPEDSRAGVLVGSLQARMAYIRFRMGEYEEARELCKRAYLMINQDEHPKDVGFVFSVMGLCCQRQGRIQEAISCHRQALALRQRAGDRAGMGNTLNNLGALHHDLGDWEQALGSYRKSLAVWEEVGDKQYKSMAQLNLGLLLVEQGQWAEAITALEGALALKLEIQDTPGQGLALVGLGNALSQSGDHVGALSCLEQGLALLEESGEREHLPEVYCLLGREHLALDRRRQAYDYLAKAIAIAKDVGDPLWQGIACREMSVLFFARDRGEDALALASGSVNALKAAGNPLQLAKSYEQLAAVLSGLGREQLASAARKEARALVSPPRPEPEPVGSG